MDLSNQINPYNMMDQISSISLFSILYLNDHLPPSLLEEVVASAAERALEANLLEQSVRHWMQFEP